MNPSTKDLFSPAYDPERFRAQGHSLVDDLADYLAAALSQKPMAVLPSNTPKQLLSKWTGDFPSLPKGDLSSFIADVIAGSNHLHHPHYMGHQCAVPLPLAALCDFAAALLNNTNVFEMAPVGTVMERRCIEWMAKEIGFTPRADGILTSGGSLGNLTALLAAQQVKTAGGHWSKGGAKCEPLAVLVSEQAHYSIKRALQILGWGEEGVVKVPTNAHFQLDAKTLPQAMKKAEASGRKVIAVVANACSTATGSYDPINDIADFCEAHGLWLHVDGAHGASALLSEKYKPLLAGIERADSVVWDAHKMMMMPALISAVIFKDGTHSFKTFSQNASYLFEHRPEEEWYNMAQRTFECTRGMLSLKLYASLSLLGTKLFGDYVTHTYDKTKEFYELVKKAADFEAPHEPQCNILCFRYVSDEADLDALQVQIRHALIEEGSFHIVQTTLQNGIHLRCTVMNPFTRTDDFVALMERIRAVGASSTFA